MKINCYLPQKQQGVVFVTALVFLAVITLLGVTAMKTANLEERMAGNMRDRNVALQMAEMTLRYAEKHIADNDLTTNVPMPIEGVANFDVTCTGGFCYYGAGVAAPDELDPDTASWLAYCTPDCPLAYVVGTVFSVNGIPYAAPALPVGVPAPTYLIEATEKTPADYYYRITVRAQGANAGTVVWLQEIFRP